MPRRQTGQAEEVAALQAEVESRDRQSFAMGPSAKLQHASGCAASCIQKLRGRCVVRLPCCACMCVCVSFSGSDEVRPRHLRHSRGKQKPGCATHLPRGTVAQTQHAQCCPSLLDLCLIGHAPAIMLPPSVMLRRMESQAEVLATLEAAVETRRLYEFEKGNGPPNCTCGTVVSAVASCRAKC